MKYFTLLFAALIFSTTLFAHDLQGFVVDQQTGERLVGANIYVKDNYQIATATGLDGSFALKGLPAGTLTLVCTYVSYQQAETQVTLPVVGHQDIFLNMVSYENELKDVLVVSSNKNTDIGVRTLERLSSNVINIVSARSIEISPDLNVANVIGRMSGVTLERNSSGEAEYAVLRGMDKRYNITLVNGVKIASPNNKQRYVPLNIFPSELLDRLEVTKTRDAAIEGDATGGAVNMVMKDAPARLSVRANASLGYSAMFFDRQFTGFDRRQSTPVAPYEQYGRDHVATMSDFGNHMNDIDKYQPMPNFVAGVSVGNRVFDRKFGFIVAANFQNIYKGTATTLYDDEMLQTESTIRLTDVKQRFYSENQQQYGLHAKFDYVFNQRHKLEFYNFLVYSDVAQVRETEKTNYKLSYDPANGTLDLSYQTRMRNTKQYIYASTLSGDHDFTDRFDLNWTLLYSGAGLSRPDESIVNFDNLRQNYVDNRSIDHDGSERIWEHNSDRDISGLFHATYKLPLPKGQLKFQAGGLYRMKERDNARVAYTFKPVDLTQSYERFSDIDWQVYTPKGSVGPLTYQADERIAAGYFQMRYQYDWIEAFAGLRAEHTNQGYVMSFPDAGKSPEGGQTYLDLLPNLQVKYSPTEKMNLRAGYYRSINRPGYFEIVPYQIQEEEYTEYGNSDLKRTTIDNIDLRWEYFPRPTEQILVGVFYKGIQSPMEMAYYSVNHRQFGLGLTNLGNAQNIGFEVDFIKYIKFFGVKANYTYTHSTITTPKVFYGKDDNGNTKTLSVDQERPLVGQAAHVGNITLMFKAPKTGWNAQLSASFTGSKIAIVSRYLDSDYWEKPTAQLDASVEKDFKKGLSLFLKANNLLNTPATRFVKTHNAYNDQFPQQSDKNGETIIRTEYYRPTFLVGFRYKL